MSRQALVGMALGVAAGLLLPLSAPQGAESTGATSQREVDTQPSPDSRQARPTTPRAPCAGSPADNGPLRAQLEILEQTLEQEEALFHALWGRPMTPPPGFREDYDPDLLRQRLLTEVPGARWAEVDCTVWPCIGLVVHERSQVPDEEMTRSVGGPGSTVFGYNLPSAIDDIELTGFPFYQGELQEDERRWVSRLYARAVSRFDEEIGLVARNVELADP